MASKATKMAVSIGCASGVIGKGYGMPNTPAWSPRSCILCGSVANKPNWGENKGSKVSKPENRPCLLVVLLVRDM